MTRRIDEQPISLYARWLGIFFLSLIVGTLQLGALGSLLKMIALIPVAIWLFSRQPVRFSKTIICAFLFVVWIFLTCIWSIDPPASLSRSVSQISLLLLLLSAASYRFSANEIAYLKKCLVWSSRITAAAVLISASYIKGRVYLNGIVKEDPNYLCAYFAFAIVAALTALISGETTGRQRLVNMLELIVYAYIILGSGSRGGMFAIVAAMAISILFSKSRDSGGLHIVRRIVMIGVLFAAAYIAATFIEKDILLRFTLKEIEESGGTNRYEIWGDALNAFDRSGIVREMVGYGTGTARAITYLFPFSHHNVMHNMFIENLMETGVIGLVLYVLHIGSFFGAALKCRDLFCVSVMICMIVLSLSTSIYTFKPYWNIMLFILCLGGRQPDPDPYEELYARSERDVEFSAFSDDEQVSV